MTNNIQKYLWYLFVPTLMLSAQSAYAGSIVIDRFDATYQNYYQFVQLGRTSTVPTQTPFSENPLAISSRQILGGYRDLALTVLSGNTASNFTQAIVNPNPSNSSSSFLGTLRYTNESSIASSLALTWDGRDRSAGINSTGLGGIDLTRGGNLEAIGLNFQAAKANLSATVNVYDMIGNLSTATFNLASAIAGDQTVYFSYDQEDFNQINGSFKTLFNPVTSTGADFTKVGAIQLILTGDSPSVTGLTARFDSIASVDAVAEVSEPKTSLTVLVSLLVLGAIFRPRKNEPVL